MEIRNQNLKSYLPILILSKSYQVDIISKKEVKLFHKINFSSQICSLLRGGIAERGGVRVGHRIIEINDQSVVAVPHEKIVSLLATSVGEVNFIFLIPSQPFYLAISSVLLTDFDENDANFDVSTAYRPGESSVYLITHT